MICSNLFGEINRCVIQPQIARKKSCVWFRPAGRQPWGLGLPTPRFADVKLHIRLLPLQIVGKQAASTAYKARSTLRMLSLEAEDVNMARRCVRSLLSDMGVESGMWTLPDLGGDAVGQPGGPGRCFPHAAPLADADHMLHHTMGEIQNGFSADENSKDLWERFDAQLGGLAKVFSKRDHIELYVKRNILENRKIPQELSSG